MILSFLERLAARALRSRGIDTRTLVTKDGTAINVFEGEGRGTLPPVVMVHGIGASGLQFGAVLARMLPKVSRVIAPELPGHGFSGSVRGDMTIERLFELTRETLDRVIGQERVILCGNSLGGAVVLDYVKHRPERIAGLVLLSPAGARMTQEEIEEVRQTFHMKSRKDAVAFLGKLHHEAPGYTRLIAGEVRSRLGAKVVRDIFASVTTEHGALPEELARLHMPVLFQWGKSERVLPGSGLAYFRQHLPSHAVIEEPEGIAHCAHLDAPGPLARRILSFAEDARSEIATAGERPRARPDHAHA
jgi:pimeloyl-ACP methyl ester carboxylesterase